MDKSGNFGGTVSAFMNTGACISAFISPLAAAWIYTRFRSFDLMLMGSGVIYLFAGLMWLKIDATKAVASG